MRKNIFFIITVSLILAGFQTGFSQDNSTQSSGFYFDIKNINSITEIDLSSKNITILPIEIFLMKNLQSLDLRNNYITALPEEIKNLQELKVLKLNGNNIYELPFDISRLKFLKEIYLDYNIWSYRLREVKAVTNARIILVE